MAIRIANDKVVTIAYRLLDSDGRLLEEKTPEAPYEYVHGRGLIVPPVERALEGKTAGFRAEISITPRDGYGEYDANLVGEIPRSHFPPGVELSVGMKFDTQNALGQKHTVRVLEIEDEMVTVDGNHPLAGLELVFEVRVLDVRDASGEEKESGRVKTVSGSGRPVH